MIPSLGVHTTNICFTWKRGLSRSTSVPCNGMNLLSHNVIEGIIKVVCFSGLVMIIDSKHTLHVLHLETGKTLHTRSHVMTIWEYEGEIDDVVIMVH